LVEFKKLVSLIPRMSCIYMPLCFQSFFLIKKCIFACIYCTCRNIPTPSTVTHWQGHPGVPGIFLYRPLSLLCIGRDIPVCEGYFCTAGDILAPLYHREYIGFRTPFTLLWSMCAFGALNSRWSHNGLLDMRFRACGPQLFCGPV